MASLKQVLRFSGLAVAVPVFVWVPLGLIPGVPSIIDVFGIDGLKLPAGIAIGGLLLAAVGFEEF